MKHDDDLQHRRKPAMKALAALTIAALALGASNAQAGDGYGEPQYNWSGVYLGAHGGAVVDGGAVYTYTEAGNFEPADRPRPTEFDNAAVLGAHLGYLHQFGNIIAGIEASATFTDAEGSLLENPPPVGNDYQTTSELGEVYALTGRLGVAFNRFQIYGKAGWAWTDVDFQATFFNKDGPGGANGSQVSIANTYEFDGLVVGGGVEFALTERITLGVEYLHHDFGEADVETLAVTGSGITTEKVKADADLDTLTARLNFKF